ncbi:Ff.00g096060.m01.CDS01 [Fusarium sp. VM40]|nr:Ff.00g096060.m01.CDS01 [Fusarium sp. VM40]
MDHPAPTSSQVSEVSEVYNAVTFLLQKLQSLAPRVSGTLDVNLTTQDGRNILSLKAEVGGPKAQDDAARSPATTFHRFRELPAEIRVMIWKIALQTPRIFRLGPASDDFAIDFQRRWVPILNPHKPPACAQACREPRAVFKTEAKQLFGLNDGIYKSLWFSPSTDIVYWDREIVSAFRLGNFGSDFPDIRNLAVDCPGDDDLELEILLRDVSSMFPDCKRLIVVMVHQPLSTRDVSFTKIKDDDEMNIPFSGDWCQWGEIRREISELFPLNYKKEKPSIEGVEVTAVRKRRSTIY